MPIYYQAAAVSKMLESSPDSLRGLLASTGLEVAQRVINNRLAARQYTLENVFTLARAKHKKRAKLPQPLIITIYIPKGGVGKTTLSSNLACYYSLMGYRVLVVDIDSQANLSMAFGYDPETTAEEADELGIPREMLIEYHLGHLLPDYPEGNVPLEKVLRKPYGEDGPHLIPADVHLDRLDFSMAVSLLQGGGETKLAKLLHTGLLKPTPELDLTEYDIILFDAAPAKNRITRSALIASDHVVAPVSCEKFSTKAVSYLAQIMTDLQEQVGRAPSLHIVNNFHIQNRNRVISQMAKLARLYPTALLEHRIHRSEEFPKSLADAPEDDLSLEDHKPPLILAKPGSPSSAELRAVGNELLHRMGVRDD